tara:strand:+ start:46 stop:612 length:567 start_codon:yes stop_codon:yes gene_type:complete
MESKTKLKKTVFDTLSSINVNDKTEKKGNLTYLSWAWAWAEVKKNYPNVERKVYENVNQCNYFTDGKSCWVKIGITIENIEHIDYLPIMDFKNKSIPLDNITSFDVNKAIQRSTTKALALHGLGLYIYAGEDLPEGEIVQILMTDDIFEKCKALNEGQIEKVFYKYKFEKEEQKEELQEIYNNLKSNN